MQCKNIMIRQSNKIQNLCMNLKFSQRPVVKPAPLINFYSKLFSAEEGCINSVEGIPDVLNKVNFYSNSESIS